ncbi:MAG: DUF3189 family protein [Bacillota bacterium]
MIYHCYGGAHSSVTAANIHVGRLPRDRAPLYSELVSQNFFDLQRVADTGKIILMGQDIQGNHIYVVGRRSRPYLLENVVNGLSEIFGINKDSYIIVDVSPCVNLAMKLGGFMSRRMGLVALGRPIVTWGTMRNYKRLLDEVDKVLYMLAKSPQEPPQKNKTRSIPIKCPGVEYR